MRLLITGAGGLLGLNLALDSLREHTVAGVDRGSLRNAPFELLRYDLTDPGAFERALRESRADAVIHCAAMADVDACERDPEAAWRVNSRLPSMIAKACHRSGVRLMHISTDAVFDGTASAPYSEADRPNPTSVYAQSKHSGEGEVLAANTDAVVARVNFYGWSPTGRRSLAEFFVTDLSAGSQVKGFTDVIFCPMLVNQLGVLLLRILAEGLSGLFHVVGAQPMSKYDFGVAIARTFGLDQKLVVPSSVESAGLSARRAHNLALSVHKLSTALAVGLPDFSTGLGEFHRQFTAGYPQLIRGYQQLSTEPQRGNAGEDVPPGARSE
jgi:dTDP-4-dehydrorhamnose reductase